MQTWIPVDVQKPDPFVRVLLFDPSIPKFRTHKGVRSHNQVVIGYRYDGHVLGLEYYCPDGHRPTHWMPLPDDPSSNPFKARDRFGICNECGLVLANCKCAQGIEL